MSNKIKEVVMKNQIYYFFDGIINTKHFDPNNIKIDERSYKNILIYPPHEKCPNTEYFLVRIFLHSD